MFFIIFKAFANTRSKLLHLFSLFLSKPIKEEFFDATEDQCQSIYFQDDTIIMKKTLNMRIGISQASVFSFSATPIISVIHFDIPALNVSVFIPLCMLGTPVP